MCSCAFCSLLLLFLSVFGHMAKEYGNPWLNLPPWGPKFPHNTLLPVWVLLCASHPLFTPSGYNLALLSKYSGGHSLFLNVLCVRKILKASAGIVSFLLGLTLISAAWDAGEHECTRTSWWAQNAEHESDGLCVIQQQLQESKTHCNISPGLHSPTTQGFN